MRFPHYRNIRDELGRMRRQVVELRPAAFRRRNLILFLFGLLAASTVIVALSDTAVSREAVYMSGIFVLAAILWVTEALPLFATALLVIALEIVLLANPGGWANLGFEEGASPSYTEFLNSIADPVIILFFGGFLLAHAATKEGVDRAMAGVILRIFRGRPMLVLFGLMAVTALFSMFMSNTASTAMMLTLVAPMTAQLAEDDQLRKGLVLAIPFGANIGGMGTPIGSPPNAVAVGFLTSAGVDVGFLEWMLIAVPLMLGILMVSWLLLAAFFRARKRDIRLEPPDSKMHARGWFVVGVFVATITLWLTETLHGLPTAVVAQLPIVAFTATGVLGRTDVNRLNWDILLLIAGGLALGTGMAVTGLDRYVVEQMVGGGALLLVILVVATLLLSTFMSNTAAANLILPLGISFAAAGAAADGTLTAQMGISIALAASASMALPISTPPNALAYAQGEFSTKDIAVIGSLIGILTAALILAFGGPIIAFWLG